MPDFSQPLKSSLATIIGRGGVEEIENFGVGAMRELSQATKNSLSTVIGRAGVQEIESHLRATILTPADISGLSLWLETAHRGIYADATLETLALDTEDVLGWRDLSANGFDATEATTAPVLDDDGANGLPELEFTAANGDKLTAGTAADWKFMHDGTGGTVFVVAQTANEVNSPLCATGGLSGAGFILFNDDSSTSEGRLSFALHNGSSGILNLQAGTTANAMPVATWHVACATHKTGDAPFDVNVYIDNAWLMGANPSGALPTGNSQGGFIIGNEPGSAIDLTGGVAAVLAFNRVLTEPERRAVTDYLGSRYGVATRRIACLGDSIMEGDGSNSTVAIDDNGDDITDGVPDILQQQLDGRFVVSNYAYSGGNLSSGSNTDVDEVLASATGPAGVGYDLAILWAGINDIRDGASFATVWSRFESVAATILADDRSRKLIVCSTAPFGGDSAWSADTQAVQNQYNAALKAYCDARPDTTRFVDMYPALQDPDNPLNLLPAYDSSDGLHPGKTGLWVAANKIIPAIHSLYG